MEKLMTNKIDENRRAFFKKVAYTAPAVIALGSLVKPTDADAKGRKDNSKIKPH